jgi:ribA/ribD-fused uncharacterized protein
MAANNTIYFYNKAAPYYEFSNFSSYPITLDGKVWPTTEHYFQAAKFTDEEVREAIRLAKNPYCAFKMGRSRDYTSVMRQDWGTHRLVAMMTAIRAKFTQHGTLKETLLATGTKEIVEDSPRDDYWGIGKNGDGTNHLGKLLMQLRDELRAN